MKRVKKLLVCLLTICLVINMSSCDKALEVLTLAQERAAFVETLGASSWHVSSVSRDDIDVSSEFGGFILQFDDETYETQNGKHVWANSGTWTFVKDKSDQVIRDDGVIITLVVEGNELTISFEFEENVFSIGGGRTQTASSKFIFKLIRS